MKYRSTVCIILTAIVLVLLVSASMAQPKQAAKPANAKEMTERIQTLEKENLVLREDLGKARLDAKSDLNAQIAKMNKQLEETNAKLAAEHAAQVRRNRNLWIGIGVAALAALASN